MKRIGYLYDKICSEENIRLAIKNSSKGKKHKGYVRRVLQNEDRAVLEIQKLLVNKEFNFSKPRTKTIYDNSSQKERTITVPRYYPDQIIHWALIQVLEPTLKHGMYEFSCGSVPGRGGRAVKKYIDRVLKKDVKYILKIDVKKFFPSIDHDCLKRQLSDKIKDKDCLELLFAIIDVGGQGLPIGFYTSQWLSNFYLQEIDHYIKEKLHVKYYVRYVDDMVLMDTNKKKLRRARADLSEYLEGYGLSLKENWQLWRVNSRPLDFVGFRYCGSYTRLRKRLFFHLTKAVFQIKTKGLDILRARRYISLLGWTKRINFKRYYVRKIKPVIPKCVAAEYISSYEQKQNKAELALRYGIDVKLPDVVFYRKIKEINDVAAAHLAKRNKVQLT